MRMRGEEQSLENLLHASDLPLAATWSSGDPALGWGCYALRAEKRPGSALMRIQCPGRSRALSLPTPAKGQAERHRLFRVPVCMSTMVALRQSLKLPGCADSPSGSIWTIRLAACSIRMGR